MDSRKERRIKKRIECAIYFEKEEYSGEILDMSPNGIAIASYDNVPFLERDYLDVYFMDEFDSIISGNKEQLSKIIRVKIIDRNVINGCTRIGCTVSDYDYEVYVTNLITDDIITNKEYEKICPINMQLR